MTITAAVRICTAFAFYAAVLVMLGVSLSASPLPDACRANSAELVKDEGGTLLHWQLTCEGGCPGTIPCKVKVGLVYGREAQFCSSDGRRDPCCQAILVKDGPTASWKPEGFGSCPSCGESGTCGGYFAGVGEGKTFTSACLDPPGS